MVEVPREPRGAERSAWEERRPPHETHRNQLIGRAWADRNWQLLSRRTDWPERLQLNWLDQAGHTRGRHRPETETTWCKLDKRKAADWAEGGTFQRQICYLHETLEIQELQSGQRVHLLGSRDRARETKLFRETETVNWTDSGTVMCKKDYLQSLKQLSHVRMVHTVIIRLLTLICWCWLSDYCLF